MPEASLTKKNEADKAKSYRPKGSQKMADFIGFSHRRYATVSPLPKSFKLYLIFWLLNLTMVCILFPLVRRLIINVRCQA